MNRINDDSVCELEFELTWESESARHIERFFAPRVNLWRDCLPEELLARLKGLGEGEFTEPLRLEPGSIAPLYDEKQKRTFPAGRFLQLSVAGRNVIPRSGRFYPRGLLRGFLDIFSDDTRPFRIIALDEKNMCGEFNHPLAKYTCSLRAKVESIRDKKSEKGGRCFAWIEDMVNYGPGMQIGFPGVKTDFDAQEPLARPDTQDDQSFYSNAAPIGHIDKRASEILKGVYSKEIREGSRVLDLMSGYESHLPGERGLEITGLGLGEKAMQANTALHDRVFHDLNKNSSLPFDDVSFDAVLISLSFEYLIRPSAVIDECTRVLKQNGKLLIGLSNRWFPDMAALIWPDLHEFERMGMAIDCMLNTGAFGDMATHSVRNHPRPPDDRHYAKIKKSDPIYVVAGQKM